MSDARAEFMAAMSTRYSQLVSWCRAELGIGYDAGCRVVGEALRIRPDLVLGKDRPTQFAETVRGAAGRLADREVVRQDVAEQLG